MPDIFYVENQMRNGTALLYYNISITVDANATQWDLLSATDILREMSVDYIA